MLIGPRAEAMYLFFYVLPRLAVSTAALSSLLFCRCDLFSAPQQRLRVFWVCPNTEISKPSLWLFR